jgi:hypothetical protein
MRNAKGRVDYATWPFFVGQKSQGEFGRFNFFAVSIFLLGWHCRWL